MPHYMQGVDLSDPNAVRQRNRELVTTGPSLIDTLGWPRLAELAAHARLRGISREQLLHEIANEWLSNNPIDLGDPRYGR
jgi:hypothetical protein